MLLLQALTQQRGPAVSPTGPPLPAPFREIIHNGISGAWDLDKMALALEATAPQPIKSCVPVPYAGTHQEPLHKPASVAEALPKTPVAQPAAAQKQSWQESAPVSAPHPFPVPAEGRIRVPLRRQAGPSPRWLVLLAVAVLCLMSFAAYTVTHRHGGKEVSANQAVAPTVGKPQATPAEAAVPPVAKAMPAPDIAPRESWRVVAYTYNRQDQAAAKAHMLEKRYGALHPAVFSPTGRAPFLVTIGGPLSREAALKLRDRLRRNGLPRDLYVRNYTTLQSQ